MSDQNRKSPIGELHEHQHSTQNDSSESNSADQTNPSSNGNLNNKTVSFSNKDSQNSSELDKTLTNDVNLDTVDNSPVDRVNNLADSPVNRELFPKPSFKPLTRVQNTQHSGTIENRKVTPYPSPETNGNIQKPNNQSVFDNFKSNTNNQSTPARPHSNQPQTSSKSGESYNERDEITKIYGHLNDLDARLIQCATKDQINILAQNLNKYSESTDNKIEHLCQLFEDMFKRTEALGVTQAQGGINHNSTAAPNSQTSEMLLALQKNSCKQNELQHKTHEILCRQVNAMADSFATLTKISVDIHTKVFSRDSFHPEEITDSSENEDTEMRPIQQGRAVQRTPLVEEPHIRPVQNTRRQYNERNPTTNSQVNNDDEGQSLQNEQNLSNHHSIRLDSTQMQGLNVQNNIERNHNVNHAIKEHQNLKQDHQNRPSNKQVRQTHTNSYENTVQTPQYNRQTQNRTDAYQNQQVQNNRQNSNHGRQNQNRQPCDNDQNDYPSQHNFPSRNNQNGYSNNNRQPSGCGQNDFNKRNQVDLDRREAEKTARRLCSNPKQVPTHNEDSDTKGYFILDKITQFCESNNLDKISLVKGWLHYAFPTLPASQYKNAHNKASKNLNDDMLDDYLLRLARVMHGIKRPLTDLAKSKLATESVTSFANRMLVEFKVVTKHDIDDFLNPDDIVTDVYNHLCSLEIDDVGKHVCMMKKQNFKNNRVTTEDQLIVIAEDVDEIIRNNHTIKNPGNLSTEIIAAGAKPDTVEIPLNSFSNEPENNASHLNAARTNSPQIECSNKDCRALFERKRPYDNFCYNCLPMPAPGVKCNICEKPFQPEKEYYVSCRPCHEELLDQNSRSQKFKHRSKDDRSYRTERRSDQNRSSKPFRDHSRDGKRETRRDNYQDSRNKSRDYRRYDDHSGNRGRDFSRSQRERYDSVNSSGSEWKSDLTRNNSRERVTRNDDKPSNSSNKTGAKDSRYSNAAQHDCGVISSGRITGTEYILHTDTIGKYNLKEAVEPFALNANHSRLIGIFTENKFSTGIKGKALFDSGANLVTISKGFLEKCEREGSITIPIEPNHKKVRDFEGKECATLGTARFGIKIGESTYEADFTVIHSHHGCDIILGTPFLEEFGILCVMKDQIKKIMTPKNQ